MDKLEFSYYTLPPGVGLLEYQGSAMRSGHRTKGIYFPPEAHHYLCPKCGVVWLAIVPIDESAKVYHRALSMPCPKHGPGWANFDTAELKALPPEMVRREFDLCALDPEAWRAFSRAPFTLTSATQLLDLTSTTVEEQQL